MSLNSRKPIDNSPQRLLIVNMGVGRCSMIMIMLSMAGMEGLIQRMLV